MGCNMYLSEILWNKNFNIDVLSKKNERKIQVPCCSMKSYCTHEPNIGDIS